MKHMHKQLLSDRERLILKEYLKTGKKEKGFRLIKLRILRNINIIKEDYQLIQSVVQVINE